MMWTPARIDAAKQVLAQYPATAFDVALARITDVVGHKVTADAIQHAFKRAGIAAPTTFLAGALTSPGAIDPLDRFVEASKVQRLKAERKDLLERLVQSESRNELLQSISAPVDIPPIVAREKPHVREATMVALASDWHVGERVERAKVSGRNSYSTKIAEERAVRFFDGILWLLAHNRHSFKIKDLVLWLGGDLITGYIHDELEEDNPLSPVEEILLAKRLVVAGLTKLLHRGGLERIVIPCSYGNHGRTTAKKRIKTGAKNSFEWLLYKVLEQQYRGEKRVDFVVDQSAHQYVQVYDYVLHFHHGDEVNYWGGVGGLSIPLNKRVPRWEKVRPADYHHIGHFHQLLDLGNTMVNGSLIGYTEYAMAAGCDYERPQQGSYLLDSKQGKCMVSPIWVDLA